jgi:septum formation protein
MERILLASNSLRRRELLENAGIPFDCLAPDVDETCWSNLPPTDRVLALAEEKVRAAVALSQSSMQRLVLAADTLVCVPDENFLGGEQGLGKPKDMADAYRMIRLLAGKSHMVRTGIALLDRFSGSLLKSRSDSKVVFAPMSEADIEAYLRSTEWMGVAGAYRIQGLASFFIDRLEGSWTGVVGLPLRELYVILLSAGFRVQALAT